MGENVGRFLLFVFLSLLLILGDNLKIFNFIDNSLQKLLIPIEKNVHDLSLILKRPFSALLYLRGGAQKIADLERQVSELSVNSVLVGELVKENEAMRKLLGAPLPAKWKYIPASVLGRGGTVTLSQGTDSGIEAGDAVVAEDMLVGVVKETSKDISRVNLLTNPEIKISAYIEKSGATGIVGGRFGSQIVMTQVLQSKNIDLGELVVSSGEFGAPRGLVIGKVAKILSEKSDVYQELLVDPLFDFQENSVVFVVKEDN